MLYFPKDNIVQIEHLINCYNIDKIYDYVKFIADLG